MQLKGSHSPSGLSLGLQIAAIGRRKARESGVCVGGVGDMGETGLVDRSTIRKALHKNQENKKRMKIKPLPCLEWSLPISPHQTAGIKHEIGCNPTKKKPKRDSDPRSDRNARVVTSDTEPEREWSFDPPHARILPPSPRPLRPHGLPNSLHC